jgi:HK97 family phage prohead protease
VDTKAIPLKVLDLKAGKDGYEFSAYVSTYGNVDLGGDVILKGAFDSSLANRDFRPLLWQHDMSKPIGVEKSLRSDDHGLLGTWTLMKTGPGEYAYEALKMGAVRAMSIGYMPEVIEYDKSDEDVRFLKQVDLLENSVVSLPMNEHALVTGVKDIAALLDYDKLARALAKANKTAETTTTTTTFSFETIDFNKLTFSQLVKLLGLAAAAFGDSAKNLLATLADGRDLSETKRQELEALLGTFPSLDDVRSNAQTLLQPAGETKDEQAAAPPAPPEDDDEDESDDNPTDDESEQKMDGLGLRIELAKRRARRLGVEV